MGRIKNVLETKFHMGWGVGEIWCGLAQSGRLQVALGQTFNMVSSFILTTRPLNTPVLQCCGQQQDSQGPHLHRTHSQTDNNHDDGH